MSPADDESSRAADEPSGEAAKGIEKVKADFEKLPHVEKLKPEKEHKVEVKEKLEKEHKDKPEKEKFEKEHKDKPEKEHKLEKVEIKEHKLEKLEIKEHKLEKAEIKEHGKIEIKEHGKVEIKEAAIEKTHLPEKLLPDKTFEGPTVDPTQPIDPGGLLAHADALEQAARNLRHFIEQSQRPDLSEGALRNEPEDGEADA